jgi:glutathione S-transferase
MTTQTSLPILYSFRRCPYAMRARLAIASSQTPVELREILLRDKAPAFLKTSPSATVPCLQADATVLDESLEVMHWALGQSDPDHWLDMPEEGHALITEADGPFKAALDRTKYHTRYGSNPEEEREKANAFLSKIDAQIGEKAYLYKDTPSLADMAILPFVRQFAFVDKAKFDTEPFLNVQRWLEGFLTSSLFEHIMPKYAVWREGDTPTYFP